MSTICWEVRALRISINERSAQRIALEGEGE
jgi:hypothetical protein